MSANKSRFQIVKLEERVAPSNVALASGDASATVKGQSIVNTGSLALAQNGSIAAEGSGATVHSNLVVNFRSFTSTRTSSNHHHHHKH